MIHREQTTPLLIQNFHGAANLTLPLRLLV
jgi:hypothetical protein